MDCGLLYDLSDLLDQLDERMEAALGSFISDRL